VEALNAADWVIVTVVGLSMLTSLVRGFIREALSLAGWVLGFVVAMVFADRFAYLLSGAIADVTGRYVVAFALLFALTMIAVALFGKLLRALVEFAGLGALDRVLGMAFGFARGVFVLLAAVVMLRAVLELDRFEWWQGSVLLPHLLLLESWFRDFTGMLSAMLAGAGN
jgi:membrane protein required for colicin V production